MLFENCKFNELRDSHEVDQFGFVDLYSSLASGVLPASVPAAESAYDAVGSDALAPSQICGVPSDVFDAFEMRDALRAASAHKKSADDAAAAAAAATQQAASSQSAPTE